MTNRKTLQAIALGLTALCATMPVTEAQYEESWVARHDGPEVLDISSSDHVTDMVVRDGYVYVTGYENGLGSLDWATVKYDYAGQELWVRTYERGIGQAKALLVDAAGHVYVTGYTGENGVVDLVTLKYSPTGEVLWEARYSNPAGNQDRPSDMSFDASGNLYIAGASHITAQGDVDLLLLKYDPDGMLLWDRTLDSGSGYTDAGYVLAIDPAGNAVVAGWAEPNPFLVKYSPTGELLWADEHVGFSTHDWWQEIEIDAAGNIYVLGEVSPPSQSNHLWTSKYDPDGNIIWERTYTGTHSYACYEGGMALMPDGGVVICGQSWDEPSNISIVTIRYAPDGTELWRRLEKAGYAHSSGDDVVVGANGDIYVTGYGYNFTYWDDMITLGYSPDGDLLWTQIYAGTDYASQSDYPHAIAVDEDANLFVAANSWGDDSNDFTTIRYSPVPTCPAPVNYCDGSVNSSGSEAVMTYTGSPSLSADDFFLVATGCPANQFGIFYYGDGQSSGIPLGNGRRCVIDNGGGIYRFGVFQIDDFGVASMKVDFTNAPAGGGAGAWSAGETWNCQAWFRDPPAGGANFNLSDALEVTVWP